MDLAEFYSNYDHADGFGSTAGGRLNPHRGGDVPHSAGTPIPTYDPITITLNRWHAGLGWIAEGETPAGRFIGFRHMLAQSPHSIGSQLSRADAVGLVGDSGTLAQGDHLCTTNASGPGGVLGHPALVSDPWPYIAAALSGTATAARPTPTPWELDMANIVHTYPADRADTAVYGLDLDNPIRPMWPINGGELAAGNKRGVPLIEMTPADFQEAMRKRGIFKYDGAQRIRPFTEAELAKLTPLERQYAVNYEGLLAVRAAG